MLLPLDPGDVDDDGGRTQARDTPLPATLPVSQPPKRIVSEFKSIDVLSGANKGSF